MRKIYSFLLLVTSLMCGATNTAKADVGFWSESACSISLYSGGESDQWYESNNPDNSYRDLDVISSLYLKGFWFKMWENEDRINNETPASMKYAIFQYSETLTGWNTVNVNARDYSGWNDGTQNVTLKNEQLDINLLDGLNPGSYTLVYYFVYGNDKVLDNVESYYQIDFTKSADPNKSTLEVGDNYVYLPSFQTKEFTFTPEDDGQYIFDFDNPFVEPTLKLGEETLGEISGPPTSTDPTSHRSFTSAELTKDVTYTLTVILCATSDLPISIINITKGGGEGEEQGGDEDDVPSTPQIQPVIYYTTTDGSICGPAEGDTWGSGGRFITVTVVSNTFDYWDMRGTITLSALPRTVPSDGGADWTWTNLATIELPESVQSIDTYTFASATRLTGVYLHSRPNISEEAFCEQAYAPASLHFDLNDNSYMYQGVINGSSKAYPEEASYTRMISKRSQWGTLVLPFAITSNDDVQLYSFGGISVDNESQTGTLTVTPVDFVNANIPCIFKKKVETATSITVYDEQYSTEILGYNDNPITSAPDELSCLNGVYTRSNKDGVYFIAQNQFWWAEETITVNPFRAYIELLDPEYAPARLSIVEEGVEGIQLIDSEEGTLYMVNGRCHDLQGRRIDQRQKGLQVRDGRVSFVR